MHGSFKWCIPMLCSFQTMWVRMKILVIILYITSGKWKGWSTWDAHQLKKNRRWPEKTWTLQVPPTPGITSCKIPLDMEVHMVLWIFPWNKTIQLWRYLHDYGTPATEHLSSGFTLAIGRQKTRTLICCSCSSVSSMARTIQGDVSANYRYSIYIYIYIYHYISMHELGTELPQCRAQLQLYSHWY